MNKLVITNNTFHISAAKNTLTIPFAQATNMLPFLRSSHFSELQIVLGSKIDDQQLKFLMNLFRIQTKEPVIFVKGDDQMVKKLKPIMIQLGHHLVDESFELLRFGKQIDVFAEPEKKIPYGYHSFSEEETDEIDEEEMMKNQNINLKKQKVETCADKPRACANCSCGRKQAQQKPLSKQELVNSINEGKPVSGCGKCYLGDSFRCATCPYNGMPAFKPGQKLKLVDNQTVIVEESQQSSTKVSNGKVKIEL